MAKEKPIQSPLTLVMKLKISSPDDIKKFEEYLEHAHKSLVLVFDRIKVVHFARFVILDGKEGKELGIFTEFDGEIEKYVGDFIDLGHSFIDEILEVVKDPPRRPIINHRLDFLEWAKAHNVPTLTFYSAYPKKQVIDIVE